MFPLASLESDAAAALAFRSRGSELYRFVGECSEKYGRHQCQGELQTEYFRVDLPLTGCMKSAPLVRRRIRATYW